MIWKRFAEVLLERVDREAPATRDSLVSNLFDRLVHHPLSADESARTVQLLQKELARRAGEQKARTWMEYASLTLEKEQDQLLQAELSKQVAVGIPGFERLVAGLPACSTELLVGPPGSGKTTLCKQYVLEGLREGQACVMVSTTEDKVLFEQELQRISGLDIAGFLASGQLSFIDVYSWTHGGRATGLHNGVYASASPHLDDVSLAIHYAMEGTPHKRIKRMAFDTLSTLFLHNPPEQVLRFTELLRGRLNSACFTTLLAVEEGMHPPEVLRALNTVTDGTLLMSADGSGHYASLPRLRGSPAVLTHLPLEFTQRGLRVADVWQSLGPSQPKR